MESLASSPSPASFSGANSLLSDGPNSGGKVSTVVLAFTAQSAWMTCARGTAILARLENDQFSSDGGDATTAADTAHRLARLGYPTEAVALLGLGRLHGIGFQTLMRLGGRAGIRKLLEARDIAIFDEAVFLPGGRFSAAATFGGWQSLRRHLWQQGTETAEHLVDAGVRLLFDDDPEFPAAFAGLPAPSRPRWLFCRGDLSILARPCVTVVGTREPTVEGEFLARHAVSAAAELHAPVVSGLARGIDRVVHEWCLRIGLPTISVLGTGIMTPYPARHAGLGEDIVRSGGLLLSEYMPDQGPSGENFVWRNRLQAALGCALVPAEWARKSGTAHTVRFARELARPVIGVRVSGATVRPDAGEADRTYALPSEHAAFTEALAAALGVGAPAQDARSYSTDREPGAAVQLNLFGGAG